MLVVLTHLLCLQWFHRNTMHWLREIYATELFFVSKCPRLPILLLVKTEMWLILCALMRWYVTLKTEYLQVGKSSYVCLFFILEHDLSCVSRFTLIIALAALPIIVSNGEYYLAYLLYSRMSSVQLSWNCHKKGWQLQFIAGEHSWDHKTLFNIKNNDMWAVCPFPHKYSKPYTLAVIYHSAANIRWSTLYLLALDTHITCTRRIHSKWTRYFAVATGEGSALLQVRFKLHSNHISLLV